MIEYDPAGMSLTSLFKFKGSVMPAGLCYAIPCGVLASLLSFFEVFPTDESYAALAAYVSFNSILGFLIVFRTQQAYSRYWEGLTLLQRVRGLWFNATSSLVAFCSADESRQLEVQKFRLMLVRLVSMLHCAALRRVAFDGAPFDLIEVTGMSEEALRAMRTHGDPCLVIMQWIQQLIVSNIRQDVINIPPPIVSRVFQELSHGIVNLSDAEKISNTPFPFSSAQMIAGMMMCQWVISPVLCTLLTSSFVAAGVAAFFAVFLLACLNLMASEIEMPFGDDPNDLPLSDYQITMNQNLRALLNRHVNQVPEFEFVEASARCDTCTSDSVFTVKQNEASSPLLPSPTRYMATISRESQYGLSKGAALRAKRQERLKKALPSTAFLPDSATASGFMVSRAKTSSISGSVDIEEMQEVDINFKAAVVTGQLPRPSNSSGGSSTLYFDTRHALNGADPHHRPTDVIAVECPLEVPPPSPAMARPNKPIAKVQDRGRRAPAKPQPDTGSSPRLRTSAAEGRAPAPHSPEGTRQQHQQRSGGSVSLVVGGSHGSGAERSSVNDFHCGSPQV